MQMRSAVAVALLCVGGVAHAADKPVYQAAPDWVAAAPEPDFAKLTDADPVIVILDQQQRLAGGEVWTYVDQAMRVVSSQMLGELGQVKLPWAPDSGDLIIHRAQIIRGAERIDLLASGQKFQVLQREEQLEQRMLNGQLTATMAVEGLRVGDVLRLSFSVTTKDKALGGNVQAFQSLLGDPARAKFARARLSWPAGSDVKWRTYAEGVTPQVTTKAGFNEIELPLPLAKQPELPGDAPARYRRLPILEASSFADWTKVSAVMAPLYQTEGLIPAGSPLAAEAAKIAAKSTDPRERTALALRLVQDEIRYLFKGMDGGNYIPQVPAQTWSLRYGDCKAKTLLLLALLRQLGVEAEAVAASSQFGDRMPQRLPSAGAFDHVLVRATIAGKSLWLDGTASGTRFADLDDTPPFRYVLPLRTAGSDLMPVPMHAPARPVAEIAIDYDQRAGLGLPVPFEIRLTMRGQMAEMMHVGFTQMGKEQRDQAAQGLIGKAIGDAMLSDSALDYDPETASATVTAKGIVGSPWSLEDSRYRMTLDKTVSEIGFEPDRARSAWKDIPVATGDAGTMVYRVRVQLPNKGDGFALEGDQALPTTLAGVQLKRSSALAGGMVTIEDRMEGSGGEIAPADVAAARAQVALAKTRLLKIAAPEAYPARWKAVAEAQKSGAMAPILAAYAKAIANDPKEALGYKNRAEFYRGIWDWKSALADYAKAIAIEPSADLYLARSYVREAVKDDAGALADAQAALGLDLSSAAATRRVATLRLRRGDKDAALAMVADRIATAGDEKPDYVSLEADLLGEAGRAAEGITALDRIIKSNPGKADLLNSRCWLKATMNIQLDTGLKDCTRAIEMAEQPASIYDSRALVYYRMGRIEEALADLDAALEVAPSQGASLYLRGVIRHRMGLKSGDDDLAAARLMWPRIDEDYARYDIKP